jgi:hypothetical protein
VLSSLKVKTKNFFTGFILLVVIVAAVLLIGRKVKVSKPVTPVATPSIQQKIESKFKGLTIPANVEQVELKDVSGGGSMGVATRQEIIADLPNLRKGKFYQGFLENTSGKSILLGNLSMAKGGWILEYNSSNYPGYNKVTVMEGKTLILEGSF